MPYYLQKAETANDAALVDLDTMTYQVDGGATRVSFDIEFVARRDGTDFIPCGRLTDSNRLVFLTSSDTFELRVENQTFSATLAQMGIAGTDSFHKYKLEHREINTTYETTLFVDDVQIVTWTIDGIDQWTPFNRLFNLGNATRYGAIKYYSYTDNLNAANSRYYDADASGGTGSVLPETTGNGTDGTLTDFPVDDSQWVQEIVTTAGISTKTLERLGVAVSATAADVFVWSGHDVNMKTTAADHEVLGATITSGVLQEIDLSSTGIAVSGNITVVVIPATGGPGIAIETTAEDIA